MSDFERSSRPLNKKAPRISEGANVRALGDKALRLLVVQVLLVDIGQVAVEIATRKPVCHGEVLVQVVTALLGSSTGDIALKARDKLEQLTHERQDLLARHLAKNDEVKAVRQPMGPK